jgi:hypothetical protein
VLLDGLPVTPVEWFDSKWIKDRLKLKLGTALAFKADATTQRTHSAKHHKRGRR